jgi:intracellular septation protein
MSSLLELLLAAVFILSYIWKGIYAATEVLMVGSVLAVALSWLLTRRVKPMLIITMLLSLVFGSVTLLLHDPVYIKWKFSVVEWLMGLLFLGSQFIGDKPLVRRAMDEQFQLPDAVWTRLNLMWAAFFLALGTLNVYVLYNFSTEVWFRFKFGGAIGLALVLAVVQAIYLARHMPKEDKS